MKYYNKRAELDELFKELYLDSSNQTKKYDDELYLKLRAALIYFAETHYLIFGVKRDTEVQEDKIAVEKVLTKYPFLKEFPNWRLLQYVVTNHNKYAKFCIGDPRVLYCNKELHEAQLEIFTRFHSVFPEFCFADIFFYNYARFDLSGYLPDRDNFMKDSSISVFTFWDLPREIRDIYFPVFKHADKGYTNAFEILIDKQTGKPISYERFEEDEDDKRIIETTEIRLYHVADYIDDIEPYLRVNFKEKKYMNLSEEDDFEFYFDIFKALLLIDMGFEFGYHTVWSNQDFLIWQYLFTSSPYNVYNDAKKLFLNLNFCYKNDLRVYWFGRPFKSKLDFCDILALNTEMQYVATKIFLQPDDALDSAETGIIDFKDPSNIKRLELNLVTEQRTFSFKRPGKLKVEQAYTSPKQLILDWLPQLEERLKSDDGTYAGHFPALELAENVSEAKINEIKKHFVDPTLDELGKDIQKLYDCV